MSAEADTPSIEEMLVHSKWMAALARRLAPDAAAADDLVQDVWVRAVQSPPRDRKALRAWLARVLSRKALDARRGEARRRGREERFADIAAPLASVPGGDELAERLDTQRTLVEELMRLEEPYRATVLLVYYQGLAPSEIARAHGVPAGTVRWRLKHGLDALRERVAQRLGPDAVGCLAALGQWGHATSGSAGGAAVAANTSLVPTAAGAVKILSAAALLVVAGAATWSALEPAGVLPADPPAITPELALAGGSEVGVALESTGAPVSKRVASTGVVQGSTAERTVALSTRIIDEAGAPLPGVSLEFAQEEWNSYGSARSDGDGQVELLLDWDEPQWKELAQKHVLGTVYFVCSLEGKALAYIETPLSRDNVAHLPDVVLVPECRVSGRVLDVDGMPLASERVQAVPAHSGADPGLADEGGSTPRSSWGRGPAALTDAEGRFLLTQAAPGFLRAWAGGDERRYTYSRLLDLESGEGAEVELVIENYAPTDLIEGVVHDPEGRPLAGIYVKARGESTRPDGSISGSTAHHDETDGAGRFRFILHFQAPYELRAFDPDPGSGLLPAEGIVAEPGQRDLVLVLATPRNLALHVFDTGGAPVEEFDVFARPVIASHLKQQRVDRERLAASGAHPAGEADVGVPEHPFHLRIVAGGYRTVELGPLELDAVQAPLAVTLERLPGIRGRVIAGGKPVVGARVELLAVRKPDSEWVPIRNHLPCVVDFDPADVAETDPDGAFLVTWGTGNTPAHPFSSRKDRKWFRTDVARIRVAAEGFAPVFLSERAVSELAEGEVEIELSRGGVLEGRVVVDEGFWPVGTIVAITNGDGHPASARAGEDGAFRFERLTPGDWLVWTHDEDLDDRSGNFGTTTARDFSFAALADCRIEDGKTTSYVLDLRGKVCRFDGSIAIDGVNLSGRMVRLNPLEHRPSDDLRGVVPAEGRGSWIDAEGRFACAIRRGRRYELALDWDGHWVRDVLELNTPAFEWRLDLSFGSLSIEHADAGDLALFHVVQDGARTITTALPIEDGRVAPTRVPAGEGKVVRGHESRGHILSAPRVCKTGDVQIDLPKEPPVLATVTVVRGEVTSLDSLDGP